MRIYHFPLLIIHPFLSLKFAASIAQWRHSLHRRTACLPRGHARSSRLLDSRYHYLSTLGFVISTVSHRFSGSPEYTWATLFSFRGFSYYGHPRFMVTRFGSPEHIFDTLPYRRVRTDLSTRYSYPRSSTVSTVACLVPCQLCQVHASTHRPLASIYSLARYFYLVP
jgi:hypothetical protein